MVSRLFELSAGGSDKEDGGSHTCAVRPEEPLWMMDCSEEVQCVCEEPTAQLELKKGMSIFIDVSKTISNLYTEVLIHLCNNYSFDEWS